MIYQLLQHFLPLVCFILFQFLLQFFPYVSNFLSVTMLFIHIPMSYFKFFILSTKLRIVHE